MERRDDGIDIRDEIIIDRENHHFNPSKHTAYK